MLRLHGEPRRNRDFRLPLPHCPSAAHPPPAGRVCLPRRPAWRGRAAAQPRNAAAVHHLSVGLRRTQKMRGVSRTRLRHKAGSRSKLTSVRPARHPQAQYGLVNTGVLRECLQFLKRYHIAPPRARAVDHTPTGQGSVSHHTDTRAAHTSTHDTRARLTQHELRNRVRAYRRAGRTALYHR